MRNLKRALSLTLASVMLMGMMVVGSSAAAGYDDVAETDNVEAIEVLQTIEVMVGDERGFGPERPVNRAEMAVVMGKLLSLDYNYYTALCPFTDVYDWAQGWVGACYANKIVSGRGDGIYDPGATVTAVEAASMLMRALGYFQYQNDYSDGFELATVTQGKKIGIFDNVGSSASEPMTRNQVAQMVLNALQSAVVEPDGNTINLTTPDGTVLTGKVNYVSVTSRKPYAQAISSVVASSIGSTNDGFIVELGERLYDGELKLYDKQVDVFNRPSRVWEYKGNEIGTYVKKELLKQTYTAKVTGADLYDLLTKNTIDTYRFEIAIDGVQYDEPNGKAVLNSNGNSFWFDKDDLYRTNKDGVGGTGKGVLTEVYVDTDYTDPSSYTVYISIINTYLARAAEDYDAKNDEVKLDVYAIDDSAVSKVYVKNNPSGTDEVIETIAVDGDEFDIKDVKDEDIFLVRVADSAIQEMVEPEIMSKTTINAFSKKDWINLSGTQYDYASTARYDVDVLYKYDNTNMKDMTYNVILDKYGYAIGLERNEDPDQYVFLTGIDSGYSNLGNRNVDANIIHLDGTMETVTVDTKDSKLRDYAEPSQANTWCEYRVSSSGVYTLTEVEFDAPGATNAGGTVLNNGDAGQFHTDVLPTDEEVTIDEKHISLPTSMAAGSAPADVRDRATSVAYGDDETVYINVELDQIRAKDSAGDEYFRRVIDDVTSVEVGHRNIKISVSNVVDTDKDGGTIEGAETRYKAPDEEIYTLYDKDNYIIAVVTIGEDEGVSSNWVYVHSATGMSGVNSESLTSSSTRDTDGDWIWTRDVILNGEKTKIREKGDHLRYLDDMNRGEWYEIKYDANGYVRKTVRLLSDMENADLTDGFVSDIQDVRTAVTKKDNVLLRDEALVSGLKFDEKGTLYTQEDKTKGFAVSTEVKVVLALAGKKNSGNVGNDKVKEYNTTEDGTVYSGYRGLRAALNDMNYGYVTENPALIQLSAVLVNNSAVVIVIRDNNTAPDNKPTSGKPSDTTGGVTLATGSSGLMVPASGDSLGSVSVMGSGTTKVNVTFKAPEWAHTGESTDVTFDMTMKVNGKEWAELTGKTLGTGELNATSGVYSKTYGNGDAFDLSNYVRAGVIDPETDKITVEISNVKWASAKVKYYIGDKEVTASATVDGLTTTATSMTTDKDNPLKTTIFQFAGATIANDYDFNNAKYTISGAVTVKESDATKLTGDLTSSTTADVKFDADGIYAKGKEEVVVTITGLTPKVVEEAQTYKVVAGPKCTGSKAIEFCVVDTITTSSPIPADNKWSASLDAVEEDQIVLVRAKTDGIKLKSSNGLIANNVRDTDALDAASVTVQNNLDDDNTVYYFSMVPKNLMIMDVETNEIVITGVYVSQAVDKINAISSFAKDTSNQVKIAEKIVDYINNHQSDYSLNGLKAEVAKDNRQNIVGVKIGTATIVFNNITADVASNMTTVKVENNPIIIAKTATVKDALDLESITVDGGTGSDTDHVYVLVKRGSDTIALTGKNATANTDLATVVAANDEITTNGTNGFAKLTAPVVTAGSSVGIDTSSTLTATVKTGDSVSAKEGTTGSAANFVKIGVAFTVTVTGFDSKEAADNTTGAEMTDNTSTGADFEIVSSKIGKGTKVDTTTPITVTITVTRVTSAVAPILESANLT